MLLVIVLRALGTCNTLMWIVLVPNPIRSQALARSLDFTALATHSTPASAASLSTTTMLFPLQHSLCRCTESLAIPCATAGESPGDDADGNTPQWQLPTALQLHILSFLPPNDRALSGRLVSPDAAGALTGPDHCTASLSQPLPPHAVPLAVEAGQQHVRQLPFQHKLQLLCTAAASGSEVNLEAALAALQPSVFPELLLRGKKYCGGDPGVSALAAGHPQLLDWLLHRCPNLLRTQALVEIAALSCDLEGLQTAWGLLKCYRASRAGSSSSDDGCTLLDQSVLDAAAKSAAPDAVTKMEWVLSAGQGSCSLQESTAVAAARSGDLGRLRWLRDRGCPVSGVQMLEFALRHADLTVAQWLVDEAGCELPAAGSSREWDVFTAAVRARDAVAKLQWLHDHGAPPLPRAGDNLLVGVVYAAVRAGRVDVLQHLRSLPGLTPQQDREILRAAFRPDDLQSVPMAEYLWRAGMELNLAAYAKAAGSLDMVRWLAQQVSSGLTAHDLYTLVMLWPRNAPAHSQALLEAMQLLVDVAGRAAGGMHQAASKDWLAEQLVCAAAQRGELALVQYLLQQLPGYQPGGKVLAAAAEGGCEALLEWLAGQHPGCLAGPWVPSAYIAPAKRRDMGTLAALRRLGVPWGVEYVVVQAVEERCTAPVLRWLVAQGAPVGDAVCLEQAVVWAVQLRYLSVGAAAWVRSVAAAAAPAVAAAGKP